VRTLVPIALDDPIVVDLIARYVDEVVTREAAAGRSLDLSLAPGTAADAHPDQMTPPRGAFFVVHDESGPVACGGVRVEAPGDGEIKRMYVVPSARGRGIARFLLGELERTALELGCTRVRLDTRSVLNEARALYASAGYVEVERYNDNPFAQHWFMKQLAAEPST
jgi:GNAT superfamily N-acetyltransferase